eukprot:gene10403-19103_t
MALAIPTIALNLALIIAILKTNARKESSQMLVLNLAFTDFGAGIIIYSYTKILLRSRRVRRQIQTEAGRFEQQRVTEKERSLLLVGGFIISSFFVCYSFPFSRPIFQMFGVEDRRPKYLICLEWTSAMANSLFNPLITCIFNPPMRREVFRILTCRCKRES